jgi:hypothetical protein
MSMPHEPSPTMNHARYVGRVGALAVALGIGVAIAHGAPVASADEGESSSGSTTSAGAHESPSTKKPSEKTSADQPDQPDRDATRSAPRSAPDRGSASTIDAASTTDSEPATRATPRKRSSDPGGSSATNAEAEADASGASPTHRVQMASAPADSPVAVARSESQATADSPTRPEDPPENPAASTALAWARREARRDTTPVSAATAGAGAATPAPTAQVQPAASLVTTSPLGTEQQLAAERTAAQTVDTLPVALMKLVLQFGFRAAAQQQFTQIGGPDAGNLQQLSAAVDEYAMGAAFQQQILDSNAPTVVMQVAPPHTWYGQTVPGSRILYDNPDTVYRFMGVNAASSYVIHGQFTGDVPADTTFSVLTGLSGNTASVLSGRDLVVGPDGRFTVTVSRDPAAPGETNHLQLTNDATLIATRNTLSDWGSEVPMTLSIERVGGPPDSLFSQLGGFAIPGIGPLVVGNPLLTTLVSLIPPLADPPPLLRGTVAAVIMALGIQREATYMAVATTDPATGTQIPPNVLKNPTRNAEFLATQLQSAGYFQLTDDQALVVTVDPGNAGYFVLPITNDWTISNDYWNQQTSLNDAQAIANADGTYTLVIAKTDPGVANWVSTGGLNQGTISMRFQDLDPASADLPTVSSRVVPLDQLGSVLPAGTVYYDAAQRSAQLAARKAGFDTRFAPYPQP